MNRLFLFIFVLISCVFFAMLFTGCNKNPVEPTTTNKVTEELTGVTIDKVMYSLDNDSEGLYKEYSADTLSFYRDASVDFQVIFTTNEPGEKYLTISLFRWDDELGKYVLSNYNREIYPAPAKSPKTFAAKRISGSTYSANLYLNMRLNPDEIGKVQILISVGGRISTVKSIPIQMLRKDKDYNYGSYPLLEDTNGDSGYGYYLTSSDSFSMKFRIYNYGVEATEFGGIVDLFSDSSDSVVQSVGSLYMDKLGIDESSWFILNLPLNSCIPGEYTAKVKWFIDRTQTEGYYSGGYEQIYNIYIQ